MTKYSVTVSAASAQELADATFKVGEALAELANVSATVLINIGGTAQEAAEQDADADADIDPTSIHEFNGKKYRKVERNAAFGDIVLITKSDSGYIDDGEVKIIGHVNSDGDLYVIDRDGDGARISGEDTDFRYLVLEPLSAIGANA